MTLTTNVLFVIGFLFLVTLYRDTQIFIADFLPSWTAQNLSDLILRFARMKARGVFEVILVLMKMEFEKVAVLT